MHAHHRLRARRRRRGCRCSLSSASVATTLRPGQPEVVVGALAGDQSRPGFVASPVPGVVPAAGRRSAVRVARPAGAERAVPSPAGGGAVGQQSGARPTARQLRPASALGQLGRGLGGGDRVRAAGRRRGGGGGVADPAGPFGRAPGRRATAAALRARAGRSSAICSAAGLVGQRRRAQVLRRWRRRTPRPRGRGAACTAAAPPPDLPGHPVRRRSWRPRHATPFVVIFRSRRSSSSVNNRRSAAGDSWSAASDRPATPAAGSCPPSSVDGVSVFHHSTQASSSATNASKVSAGASGSTGAPLASVCALVYRGRPANEHPLRPRRSPSRPCPSGAGCTPAGPRPSPRTRASTVGDRPGQEVLAPVDPHPLGQATGRPVRRLQQ